MEDTIHAKAEKFHNYDSLLLAYTVLLAARRIIRDVHALVAIIMRYALLGTSVTDHVIGLFLYESTQLE